MSRFICNRPTIYDVPPDLPIDAFRALVPDRQKRRHLSWGMDFDSRAATLGMKIEHHWEPIVQEQHRANQENSKRRLADQFGSDDIERKVADFIAMDTKPMSVLSHHNAFFEQVRTAFVMGCYYPALVGACALGERMLNHMIIDLRDNFKNSQSYKRVYSKDSFSDWDVPIDALIAWNILLPTAETEFRSLKRLRHRSIHFNVSTYDTLRADSLAAILHLRTIIDQQFGSFAARPWFISGTSGHAFIRKDYEENPFIKKYFIPNCPFVGPLFGMKFLNPGWAFFDVPDYGDGPCSDDDFASAYNTRDPEQVVLELPEIVQTRS